MENSIVSLLVPGLCQNTYLCLAVAKCIIFDIFKVWMILDVSGIIEKFNVFVTLVIMPRTKNIN